MTKNRKTRIGRRIARLERKCDRILAEVIIIRQKMCDVNRMDDAIQYMSYQAHRMRENARREHRLFRSSY